MGFFALGTGVSSLLFSLCVCLKKNAKASLGPPKKIPPSSPCSWLFLKSLEVPYYSFFLECSTLSPLNGVGRLNDKRDGFGASGGDRV